MCPVCMTTAARVAAGSASGAGVLGFVAVKFRWACDGVASPPHHSPNTVRRIQ